MYNIVSHWSSINPQLNQLSQEASHHWTVAVLIHGQHFPSSWKPVFSHLIPWLLFTLLSSARFSPVRISDPDFLTLFQGLFSWQCHLFVLFILLLLLLLLICSQLVSVTSPSSDTPSLQCLPFIGAHAHSPSCHPTPKADSPPSPIVIKINGGNRWHSSLSLPP